MEIPFSDWLEKEIDKRGWSWNRLSTEAGLSSGTIYNIRDGTRGYGQESLRAIARALRIPPETVFRAAGILPPEPEYVPLLDEWNAVFYDLNEDERQEILEIARMKVNRRKQGSSQQTKQTSRIKKSPARNALKEK